MTAGLPPRFWASVVGWPPTSSSFPSGSWLPGTATPDGVAGCGQVALLGDERLGDVGGQLAGRGPVMVGYLLGDRRFSVHDMLPPRTDELFRRRAGAST